MIKTIKSDSHNNPIDAINEFHDRVNTFNDNNNGIKVIRMLPELFADYRHEEQSTFYVMAMKVNLIECENDNSWLMYDGNPYSLEFLQIAAGAK